MVNMVSVLSEDAAILGTGCGIQGQSYVALLQGSEISAGFHYRDLILRTGFLVNDIQSISVVSWLANQSTYLVVRDRFTGVEGMN